MTKPRTNIGRTVEVSRVDGPFPQERLQFTEDNEINRTVSRAHAHVVYHKASGEYRLYNDRLYKMASKPKGSCGLCGFCATGSAMKSIATRGGRSCKLGMKSS